MEKPLPTIPWDQPGHLRPRFPNAARVFATGISNGGFFSIYLAYKLAYKIKAIAPVCAGIPEDIAEGFKTSGPVPMLLINGTEDKLVKYDGGIVGFNERWGRGKNISTDEAVRIWRGLLECAKEPETFDIPDKDEDDGCIAERTVTPAARADQPFSLLRSPGEGIHGREDLSTFQSSLSGGYAATLTQRKLSGNFSRK